MQIKTGLVNYDINNINNYCNKYLASLIFFHEFNIYKLLNIIKYKDFITVFMKFVVNIDM